jgi:AraC-like DNA-binding protein
VGFQKDYSYLEEDVSLKLSWENPQILSPTTTISEIADELNFSDQSALTNFFRTKAGITPLAYRKGKP